MIKFPDPLPCRLRSSLHQRGSELNERSLLMGREPRMHACFTRIHFTQELFTELARLQWGLDGSHVE